MLTRVESVGIVELEGPLVFERCKLDTIDLC